MATITLSDPIFYSNGAAGASYVVGYESNVNRVVRYTFVSPSSGISHVDLSFKDMRMGNGTSTNLSFYIGTSSTDHANAGSGSTYTGTLTYSSPTWSGSADVILQPSTTYYLWVFPSTTTYGWWWWNTGTASLTYNGGLKTTITASNGTLGSTHTITLTRYSTSLTHKITATCGTASTTIATDAAADSASWTPSISWAAQNTTGVSVSVTITCETFSGTTSCGTSSVTVTMAIPSSVVPTVSLSISDANGYLATYSAYVQNKSQATVTTTSAGVYGSTIKSYTITCGSLSANKASATFELPTSGTVSVTATVTDSRGRTATASTTISVLAYTPPTASITEYYRSDSAGNMDYQGAYGKAVYTASVASLDGKNSATYEFKYRIKGETEWTTNTLSESSGSTVFSASTSESYEICISVRDNFTTLESAYRTITACSVLMDFYKKDNAIGLGTRATNANTVTVGLYTQFDAGTNLDNISCCATSSYSVFTLPALTITQITLDTWGSVPDNNEFTFSDGGVKVPKSGRVMVSGSIYLTSDSTNGKNVGVYIKQNGTEVSSTLNYTRWPAGICISPKIISVSEGDVITLWGRSIEGGNCTPNNSATHLDIVYV